MDRKRKGKNVSNKDWESPSDPDSRIAKMKDGRTHLAYKAEHAVDLETEAIVADEVYCADEGDPSTGPQMLQAADVNVAASRSEVPVTELVADKGYHDNALLAECAAVEVRTYIPERRQKSRRWDDKPKEFKQAFRGNRRRVRGERGRSLSRWRSERCERSFAHVCETGNGPEGLSERDNRNDQAAPNAVRSIQLGVAPSEGVRNAQTAVCGGGAEPLFGCFDAIVAADRYCDGTDSSGSVTVAVFGALLIVVWVTVRRIPGNQSATHCPERFRPLIFRDPDDGKVLVFLTNNFDLPAETIAHLYRLRLHMELFFKWIEQNLRIKHFFGTSENAVKTHVWIAVCVYVLAAIVRKEMKLRPPLSQI
jgi:hypothetical protein